MTMQVDTRRIIAGVPILAVRHFFRHVASHHHESFSKEWLITEIRPSDPQADALLGELIKEGFIVRIPSNDEHSEYEITDKGREFIRSSASKRITRRTAETAIDGLMTRVQNVNKNPKYLSSVCSVVLFGSYLEDKDRLGDLDVAVQLAPRISNHDELIKATVQYAFDSGRRFSNCTEEIYWAEHEIYQVLKARKRTISIQPWRAFLEMEKTPSFRYRVVMGDPERIARELQTAEGKR
jgi:hypothetical protein